MTIQTPAPIPNGNDRAGESQERRELATTVARLRPSPSNFGFNPPTANNGEEALYPNSYSMSFSKGLPRDPFGNVFPGDYETYVEAINAEQAKLSPSGPDRFEATVPVGPWGEPTAKLGMAGHGHEHFYSEYKKGGKGSLLSPEVRTFESPRAGHAYDLQGPDADAVCMPPAPKVGSPEFAVEMAEVYALSLLRDVSFADIEKGDVEGAEKYTGAQAAADISGMAWFDGRPATSEAERVRREHRDLDPSDRDKNLKNLFRGAEKGAKVGPYISQFLLIGTGNGRGKVDYGAQQIDQRVPIAPEKTDYMTKWYAWMDVQNGADFGAADPLDKSGKRRFISTPRDLATYVHIDQLYQAYLNACLIMLESKVPFDRGFPSGGKVPQPGAPDDLAPRTRASFATFGGPHILATLTEVSSRALRAVRRQKYNYHRRCRPEMIGGMLTVAANTSDADYQWDARTPFDTLRADLPDRLLEKVNGYADFLNDKTLSVVVKPDANGDTDPGWLTGENYLLAMAFPEGSPMHPAYGAGHATVAGACVTVLKAFFEMYKKDGKKKLHYSKHLGKKIYIPNPADPTKLKDSETTEKLTLAGELDKLAANISIGRNMAGVHYYTDYYDSLRMGERIAVGILQEQMTNYPEGVKMTFPSFDDERIEIIARNGSRVSGGGIPLFPEVRVNGVDADSIPDWWTCLR